MKISLITREEYLRRTKYWVRYYESYCPVCSRTDVEIERVLESKEPKPSEWRERHIVEEDACYSHFI